MRGGYRQPDELRSELGPTGYGDINIEEEDGIGGFDPSTCL